MFSKGLMFLVCERWVGDGDRLLHIDSSSSGHSSTSFSSWLGLLNRGSLRAESPQFTSWFSLRHLVPDWLQLTQTVSDTWLYNCLTLTCFCCYSAYLHRCIAWLTARSRVNMLHIYWDAVGVFYSPSQLDLSVFNGYKKKNQVVFIII